MFDHKELEHIIRLLDKLGFDLAVFRVENDIRLNKIEHELHHLLHPKKHLTSIQIHFLKGHIMAAPITLTQAGQKVTAVVVGTDQFGNPWTGAIPPVTFTSDDSAGSIATLDPSTGVVTAVGNGVANITASLTTAEGKALTDTEAVIVAIPTEAPVLTSIKVDFV